MFVFFSATVYSKEKNESCWLYATMVQSNGWDTRLTYCYGYGHIFTGSALFQYTHLYRLTVI